MKKLLLLLGLAGLPTLRRHVEARGQWHAPNAAIVVAGFFAASVLVTALPLLLAASMTLLFPWIARPIVQFIGGRTEDIGRQVKEQL